MVQKSCTSCRKRYPSFQRFLYTPGGCLGFLNHQQYSSVLFFFLRGGKGCREKNVGLQGPRSQLFSWDMELNLIYPQWNQPAQVIGRMFFNQKQLVRKLPTNPPNSKTPSDSSVINSLRSSSELAAPKIKPSELGQVAACCTWNSSLASSCCFIEFFRP